MLILTLLLSSALIAGAASPPPVFHQWYTERHEWHDVSPWASPEFPIIVRTGQPAEIVFNISPEMQRHEWDKAELLLKPTHPGLYPRITYKIDDQEPRLLLLTEDRFGELSYNLFGSFLYRYIIPDHTKGYVVTFKIELTPVCEDCTFEIESEEWIRFRYWVEKTREKPELTQECFNPKITDFCF